MSSINLVYLVLGCAASVVTVLLAVAAVARYFVDHRILQHGFIPREDLETIKTRTAQLEPNHGSHLADDVKEIKGWVVALTAQLNRLEGAFDEFAGRGHHSHDD